MRTARQLHIPKLALTTPPQGDSGAVAEAAKMLVAAENPVIIAERAARTEAGMKLLVELAETLQAPVIDQGRMNLPSRHPLNHGGRAGWSRNADVILALEVDDFWGAVNTFRDQLHRTLAAGHQARREAHQHPHRRSLHEEQLPGFPALHGSRPGDGRRRRSDACRR